MTRVSASQKTAWTGTRMKAAIDGGDGDTKRARRGDDGRPTMAATRTLKDGTDTGRGAEKEDREMGNAKKSIENITRHSEESEKAIERYLVAYTEALGGVCLKYSNPGMTGYPDRLVVLPQGRTVWVELKSKGRKVTKLQALRIDKLLSLGHRVGVCDSKKGVEDLLDCVMREDCLDCVMREACMDSVMKKER